MLGVSCADEVQWMTGTSLMTRQPVVSEVIVVQHAGHIFELDAIIWTIPNTLFYQNVKGITYSKKLSALNSIVSCR